MSWLNGDFYTNYLDPIATYLGLATFLVSSWIALMITFGTKWRYRAWRKKVLKEPGDNPAAFVIDLIGKGAILAAEKFSKHNLSINDDTRILSVSRTGHISSGDVPAIITDIKLKLDDLSKMGADRIYLFISAPTPIVCIVGAELANFGGIVLMHWDNKDGVYENWGPLRFH